MLDVDDLSLRKVRFAPTIRDSAFLHSYERLLLGRVPNDSEARVLLRTAAVFLQAPELGLAQLGYRIVLQYAEVTRDFEPLRRVAELKELLPLVELIERLDGRGDSLSDVVLDSYRSVMADRSGDAAIHRTKWQHALLDFAATANDAVIVAPTSYGKSEMMIQKVVRSLPGRLLVLVPTKALIAQTRRNLLRDEGLRRHRVRVFTHPEGYREELGSFVAVMTQERAFRLMQENRGLAFDLVLVDEAHHLLENEQRSIHLAHVVLSAQHRNPAVITNYFTPFVTDHANLQMIATDRRLNGISARETVKVERLHYTRLREGSVLLYDQFLDRDIVVREAPTDEINAITSLGGSKNVVYVNRPVKTEALAIGLADALPELELESVRTASRAMADLVHPDYALIKCLQRGVLFHHGKVPEVIRQYIEAQFTAEPEIRFLATTSTLLEGVNTPADTLFIASPNKGVGHMSKSSFRNLIGRVARFSEIFAPARQDLKLLQPSVYVLDGETAPSDFNPRNFLKKVADASQPYKDVINNPMLEEAAASDEDKRAHLEVLENIEPGAAPPSPELRRAQTEIGRLCFASNIYHFDVLANEAQLSANLDSYMSTLTPINSSDDLLDAISRIFWTNIEISGADDVDRVKENREARRFYAMFIDWRMTGLPFKVIVTRFLEYWRRRASDLVYVGDSWGDTAYNEGGAKRWVRLSRKTEAQKVTLAVAKSKEEQDFLDYKILPYLEVLLGLGLVDRSFYDRVVFGTNDEDFIILLKNGYSWELAHLLRERYEEFVEIDRAGASATLDARIVEAMMLGDENDILIYEAECNLETESPRL